MNILKARQFVHIAWRVAVLCAVVCTAGSALAQNGPGRAQPGRFLLIFETSPVLKKNLPAVRQTLGMLFSSNLQNEMRSGDDIAVWTVDEQLRTGTFPLESWDPDQAEAYTEGLAEFLKHQKYTRHASLAAVQPLLNRVAKSSERLTVLIFCDSESSLVGTPYDSGVNDIITNAAARLKGEQASFTLVLRSYHGEYLGCSVNRTGPLSFPKFPVQPKPAAPPEAKPAPTPVVAPVTGPVVTPIPALIIRGTNTSTNASAGDNGTSTQAFAPATIPAPAPTPQPVATSPPVNAPEPTIATAPPENLAPTPSTPAPAQPLPAPSPASQNNSAPAPAVVSTPGTVTTTAPQSGSPLSTAPIVAASTPADNGYLRPLLIGGGLLAVAVGLVVWFMTRSRAPQGSLITSSMQDDLRPPPRK